LPRPKGKPRIEGFGDEPSISLLRLPELDSFMRPVSLPVLLWVVLSAGCHAPAWVESKPDGKFKILTPTPLVEEDPADKAPGDTVYAAPQRYGKYMVFVSEAVAATDERVIQESLRAIAAELVGKSEAKQRYLHPFLLAGKYHAVDLEADRIERKLVIRVWVVYARNRVYRLIVSGDRSWMTMAEVNKFLKSFEILE
jgi:hypothetical protein